MSKTAFCLIPCGALVLAASIFALAGCNSAPETRDLMAEEARAQHEDRPIAMKGEASFDGGKVDVVATVARGFQRVGKGPTGGAGGKGGKGGGGAERRHWGGSHDTDAFSEDYSFYEGDSDEQQKEAMKEYVRQAMARRAAGSPMPPVTLRVSFENKGTEPIEVVPTDVNSDLGNFAIRPSKLTLAAGQVGELDPMISQLGVMNDIIPLTVSIRVAGKTETQVIQIKNIISAAALKSAGMDASSPPAAK